MISELIDLFAVIISEPIYRKAILFFGSLLFFGVLFLIMGIRSEKYKGILVPLGVFLLITFILFLLTFLSYVL